VTLRPTTTLLRNARILTDGITLQDHAVVLAGAYIHTVIPDDDFQSQQFDQIIDLNGAWLSPGFVDTQVNGGGGVLFNDDPSVAGIRTIGEAHRRYGTTGFLPTCISDDLEKLACAIVAVQQAIEQRIPGVLGIHIEGPFLNPKRRGIHTLEKLRLMDREAVNLLTAQRQGCTVVTLAPEITTPEDISILVRNGVIVSAGHTDASYEVIRAALDQGLRGFTHLFNAMSPLIPRAPGVTGAALEDRTSWCGIIVDGHHVAPAVLRIAAYCKPIDKLMLVTDAMPLVGTAAASGGELKNSFKLQGRSISVHNGVCRDEHGVLAGSNLDMASAVRNSVKLLGASRAQAVQMASGNPTAFLGLSQQLGRIAAGYRANLVLMDDDFNVLHTWIDGVSSLS
jgi:N-acetylglucosamine-6-phosphate deacetylase